jgi:hypothetical protein
MNQDVQADGQGAGFVSQSVLSASDLIWDKPGERLGTRKVVPVSRPFCGKA